jgi:hypothetical protein
MISCYFALIYLSGRNIKWLFLSGLACGMAILFRHDIGLYAMISESIVLMFYFYIVIAPGNISRVKKMAITFKKYILYYCLGAATVLVPVSVYFVCNVPIDELISDLIVFPIVEFPKVRSLSYPAPLPNPSSLLSGEISLPYYIRLCSARLPFYFPFLVFAGSAALLIIELRKRNSRTRISELWEISLIMLIGLLFFNQARVRAEISHILPIMIPSIILFFVIFYYISRLNGMILRRCLLLIMMGIACWLALDPVYNKIRQVKTILSVEPSFTFEKGRAKGIHMYLKGGAYQEVIDDVQTNVAENEKIFVGNTRHDSIVVNDMMLYYLAERNSATRFHELHPGLADTESIQKIIIDDIETNQVTLIVLVDIDLEKFDEKIPEGGSRLLDEYIEDNFIFKNSYGDYSVWRRIERKSGAVSNKGGF